MPSITQNEQKWQKYLKNVETVNIEWHFRSENILKYQIQQKVELRFIKNINPSLHAGCVAIITTIAISNRPVAPQPSKSDLWACETTKWALLQ